MTGRLGVMLLWTSVPIYPTKFVAVKRGYFDTSQGMAEFHRMNQANWELHQHSQSHWVHSGMKRLVDGNPANQLNNEVLSHYLQVFNRLNSGFLNHQRYIITWYIGPVTINRWSKHHPKFYHLSQPQLHLGCEIILIYKVGPYRYKWSEIAPTTSYNWPKVNGFHWGYSHL